MNQGRYAVAGRLGQADVARDDGAEHDVPEAGAHVLRPAWAEKFVAQSYIVRSDTERSTVPD